MQGFRTYQSALELYRACQGLRLKGHLRDQLMRASSSIVLNLAEGSSQPTRANRCRFYAMAMGSLREVQAIIDLESLAQIRHSADRVGGQLYCTRRERLRRSFAGRRPAPARLTACQREVQLSARDTRETTEATSKSEHSFV